MAIDGPAPLGSSNNVQPLSSNATDRNAPTPPAASQESAFVPTIDLAALLKGVRQTSEVRQEVIGEVASRLNTGELFTRPAAEKTVEGLLEFQGLSD
jgi:hypothetical protein